MSQTPKGEGDSRKEKVHPTDKESAGTNKGVEGRKKGYDCGVEGGRVGKQRRGFRRHR